MRTTRLRSVSRLHSVVRPDLSQDGEKQRPLRLDRKRRGRFASTSRALLDKSFVSRNRCMYNARDYGQFKPHSPPESFPILFPKRMGGVSSVASLPLFFDAKFWSFWGNALCFNSGSQDSQVDHPSQSAYKTKCLWWGEEVQRSRTASTFP